MKRAALLLVLSLALAGCSGDRAAPPGGGPAAPVIRAVPSASEAPLPEVEAPRADPLDLARRLRGVTVPAAAPTAPPDYRVGDQRDFWVVQSDPPRAFQISATVRAVSAHAYFYVQDSSSVGDDQMNAAARDFEARIYPPVVRMFGEPKPRGPDNDQRISILHLQLPGVGGYFTGVDQLPRAVARVSNERQMIYIDLRSGPPGTDAYVGVVAHELQHLVHHNANPYADAWINEGLSELANESVSGNGSYLRFYQNAPGTQLNDWSATGSNAAHYGASHSFLRYLLRHYGGIERARDLAAQAGSGLNAVQRYLRAGNFGVGFEDVFLDWLVAGYLDLPGDGRFSNPGADAKVRAVTRLADPQDGGGSVHQFGADYFEIDPRGKDVAFRLRGSPTVNLIPNQPVSGVGQWWSNRGDSLDSTLTRELDLRAVPRATLRFKAWYNIERGYDYAYVNVSVDGGVTWTVVRGRYATEFDPLGYAYGPGYTGISGDGAVPAWVEEQIDLTPFTGHVVLLRFEYVTDEAASADGLAIDDIRVPEIGFSDDAEQDTGWQASGFRRISGPVPQRYLVQLVFDDGGGWKSRLVDVGADGTAEIRIPGTLKRAVVIVAGGTYGTNQTAPYHWEFGPAGG
jgi:immune inhibitor A